MQDTLSVHDVMSPQKYDSGVGYTRWTYSSAGEYRGIYRELGSEARIISF